MRPFLPSRLTYEDITKYRNDDLAATAAVSQSGARSVDASWHKKVGYEIGSEEDLENHSMARYLTLHKIKKLECAKYFITESCFTCSVK